MPLIKIKATDPLFFRTGRPFRMGVDTWTDSSIMPNPSVVWGALFSAMMAQHETLRENVLKKKISNPEEYLSVKNIYLYNEKTGTVLLPAPLDLFIDENGGVVCDRYEKVDPDCVVSSPFKYLSVPDSNLKCERVKNYFISIDSLGENYYKKQNNLITLYSFDDVFVSDSKLGIKRDSLKKNSEDKHLYRIDLIQFKEDWSFLVDVEYYKYQLKDQGLLKLGGEGKSAFYSIIDNCIDITSFKGYHHNIISDNKHIALKVILTSPAYFENWVPDLIIYSASIGKSISIGGFDMLKCRPKPMSKYVPAGSVYMIDKQFSIKEIQEKMSYYSNGFNQFIIVAI